MLTSARTCKALVMIVLLITLSACGDLGIVRTTHFSIEASGVDVTRALPTIAKKLQPKNCKRGSQLALNAYGDRDKDGRLLHNGAAGKRI